MKRVTAAPEAVAVVIGGYVNGYGVVRALAGAGWPHIALIHNSQLARGSRFVETRMRVTDFSPAQLAHAIRRTAAEYSAKQLVIFPTDDEHLTAIHSILDVLPESTFVPFNHHRLAGQLDKVEQYRVANECGVPTPRHTVVPKGAAVEDAVSDFELPVIVKPMERAHQSETKFRNIVIRDRADLDARQTDLQRASRSVPLLVSEVIPGPDDQIYAYIAFRSPEGDILREWSGRKLSQYPPGNGVFATALSGAPREVSTLGRAMLQGLDAWGIAQPEFKFDCRDGRYKLMEVNLRSMMWNHVGLASGVNLPDAQMLYALGRRVPPQVQVAEPQYVVFAAHELGHRLATGSFRVTRDPAWKRHWAIWNASDPVPFALSLSVIGKVGAKWLFGR